MREFFNEKDGFQFYSILFNEFNSVKNTRQNATDLINFLEYVGNERDKMISEAAKMLGILKKFSFSNKVLDEQHLRDLDDAIAIEQCVRQVFNEYCGKIGEFFKDFDADTFTFNILNFVQTDIFSQNNPMNNLGETFMNLLNASCESNNPQPTTHYRLEVINKNEGVCTVSIDPDDGEKFEEGTDIRITVTNTDPTNFNHLIYLGVFDSPNIGEANSLLNLAPNYDVDSGVASGDFRIDRDSYLYIEFEKM